MRYELLLQLHEAGIVKLTPTRQTTQENGVRLDICTGGKVQG